MGSWPFRALPQGSDYSITTGQCLSECNSLRFYPCSFSLLLALGSGTDICSALVQLTLLHCTSQMFCKYLEALPFYPSV